MCSQHHFVFPKSMPRHGPLDQCGGAPGISVANNYASRLPYQDVHLTPWRYLFWWNLNCLGRCHQQVQKTKSISDPGKMRPAFKPVSLSTGHHATNVTADHWFSERFDGENMCWGCCHFHWWLQLRQQAGHYQKTFGGCGDLSKHVLVLLTCHLGSKSTWNKDLNGGVLRTNPWPSCISHLVSSQVFQLDETWLGIWVAWGCKLLWTYSQAVWGKSPASRNRWLWEFWLLWVPGKKI